MRTSDRLPEECREEIRAMFAEWGDSPYSTKKGWQQALAWVLGDDGK